MGVADPSDVFAGGTKGHRHGGLDDQLADPRADHMDTQHTVRLGMSQDLDQAICAADGAGSSVRLEGERSFLERDTLCLQLLAGLPDRRDLRIGVDDVGDRVVVDMSPARSDELRDGNALFFRLVREHGALHDIADGKDTGRRRLEVVVGGNSAAVVRRESHGIEPEVVGVWTPPHGHENAVARDGLQSIRLDNAAATLLAGTGDANAELEGQALLLEDSCSLLANGRVHHGEAAIGVLQDGDLGAETRPHRAQLEADHPCTNDDQMLRHLGIRECLGASSHLVRPLDSRQVRDLTSRGDDDLLTGDGDVGFGALDQDLVPLIGPSDERPMSVKALDTVLLEQVSHAVREPLNDLVLAGQHLRQIEPDTLDLYAVLLEVVLRLHVPLAGLQEGLGRNAANAQAGPAERGLPLNARGPKTELCAPDGGHIAPWPCTDNDDVKRLTHAQISRRIRSGFSMHSLMRIRNPTASRPSTMRWS